MIFSAGILFLTNFLCRGLSFYDVDCIPWSKWTFSWRKHVHCSEREFSLHKPYQTFTAFHWCSVCVCTLQGVGGHLDICVRAFRKIWLKVSMFQLFLEISYHFCLAMSFFFNTEPFVAMHSPMFFFYERHALMVIISI
jgi:hypothetical protein